MALAPEECFPGNSPVVPFPQPLQPRQTIHPPILKINQRGEAALKSPPIDSALNAMLLVFCRPVGIISSIIRSEPFDAAIE